MDKNKKNIVLATGIYPPDIGGPATYVRTLQQELPKHGFAVKVITYGDEGSEDGVYKISRKQNIFLRYLKYFYQVWKLRKWADIFFAFDQVSSGLPVALFKIFYPRKEIIIRIGGDFLWEKSFNKGWTSKPLSNYYQDKKNIKEKIYIFWYKFILKKFDKIIFSTEWYKDIILNYFNVSKNKIFVINNPFPNIKTTSTETKKEKNNFLFIGRLIRIKNLEFLIDVFADFKNVNLKIIGDGPFFEKINKRIKKENIINIKLQKNIPHQEIFYKMQNAYALIAPSISEISPNIVLEALKMDIPVILTKETGFIRDFKDLLFFNPFDKNDLAKQINFLLDENNYQKYLKIIKNIDTSKSWNDFMNDLLKIIK